MKKLFLIISAFLFLMLDTMTKLTVLESLSLALFLFFFLEFLNDLGKRIVIYELTVIMAFLTSLAMPVLFYHVYTKENPIARLWGKYMPVSSDTYFSFMLPATLMMILGFRISFGKLVMEKNPRIYMDNVRKRLQDRPKLGLYLIGLGLAGGLFNSLVPGGLAQVFYFLEHLTYVGVFYVIYSPYKRKRLIVAAVLLLMFAQTMITGMFGEFVFILALSVVLMVLGTNINFFRKFGVALAGIILIILLQSVKADYRQHSWHEGAGADPAFFLELITDRISDPASIFDETKMFMTALRINQGWLVAYTLYKVPAKLPFANGETIWESVAACFVPRLLWPDKPTAGGRANLLRFWGYRPSNMVSMNIGPMGEAYGNFGTVGGIIYMFFYGLTFNLILFAILRMARKTPTLILWLPFLFLYSINVETDLLTTMNALLKGIFFVWMVYWSFKTFFRIEL